jgi:predicted nuclease of predicted toxin-antitoxin system
MKLKLDENMPVDLALFLRKENFKVHTVYDENLSGESDETILEAAVREKRTLFTFDTDIL